MTILLSQLPAAPSPPALTDTAVGVGGGITAYQYTFSQVAQTIVTTVVLRNYLGGMTLSNDVTSPNTIVDISDGECADSTNSTMIVNSSLFTKSISAPWASGSGNGGMGNGLSVTASTWYHVIAIINGGNPDYYFDTSASAANAPAGTTFFRRIGSIKTNASSHVLAFQQSGKYFFINAIQSLSVTMGNITGATLTTGLPTGISVIPLLSWDGEITSSSGGSAIATVTVENFAATLSIGTVLDLECQANQNAFGAASAVLGPITDTSGRIKYSISSGGAGAFASSSLTVNTVGWIDPLGQ